MLVTLRLAAAALTSEPIESRFQRRESLLRLDREPGWHPNCGAIYFGLHEFEAGRSGSVIFVLTEGLRYARYFGVCRLLLSEAQRSQLGMFFEASQLTETTDLTEWIGGPSTCFRPRPGEAPSLAACAEHRAHEVKSMLHMEVMDPRLRPMIDLRAGLLNVFGGALRSTTNRSLHDLVVRSRVDQDDTVVVHLRSGDVWAKDLQGRPVPDETWRPEHVQPPCAFYTAAVRSRPRKRVLVVSDGTENPCAAVLQSQFPNEVALRVARPLHEDAAILSSARHLVLASSMFSLAAALLNAQLQSLHVPFADIEQRWKYWAAFAWTEAPMSYTQHLYAFPGFHAVNASFRTFLDYPESALKRRSILSSDGRRIP